MIINEQFLYLHIPKTGGTSLEAWLKRNFPDSIFITDMTRHAGLLEARGIVLKYGFELHRFPLVLTTIRNPYAYEVSRYFYIRKVREKKWDDRDLAFNYSFETFARFSSPFRYGKRQAPYFEDWILLKGERPKNLRVIKLENLEEDLRQAFASIGVKLDGQLEWLNQNDHFPFENYYTARSEEAVYNKYKWIFDQGFYSRMPTPSVRAGKKERGILKYQIASQLRNNNPYYYRKEIRTHSTNYWNHLRGRVRNCRNVHRSESKILIYHMGRVGAGSIKAALEETGIRAECATQLNLWNILNPRVLRTRLPTPSYRLRPKSPMKIITLVREPISRNLSSYLNGLDWAWKTSNAKKTIPNQELAQGFFDRNPQDVPIQWFDREFHSVLSVDVYDSLFSWDQGFQRLSTDRFDMLILRAELEDKLKSEALGDFLGVSHFRIPRGQTITKDCGNILNALRFSPDYVDGMLDSKFSRHFYSPSEREGFKSMYLQGLAKRESLLWT